jgi:hypothetical protein
MFRMHANGVRGHADETPRLQRDQKRRHAKRRNPRRYRQRLQPQHSLARFRRWLGRPRLKCSCAIRRTHLALEDATSLSLAMAHQTELPN